MEIIREKIIKNNSILQKKGELETIAFFVRARVCDIKYKIIKIL